MSKDQNRMEKQSQHPSWLITCHCNAHSVWCNNTTNTDDKYCFWELWTELKHVLIALLRNKCILAC